MEDILSVTQLSLNIKQNIEGNFCFVKLRGEISGYKKHTSGHHYFSLKDDQSVIDGICWRGTRLSVEIQDGLDVIAIGHVTTYPLRSKYQIIVEQILPAGQGALQLVLKERFKKFKELGYFDESRKKALPAVPLCIGIVTSPTGAVIRDILHRIQDRFPCHILLWPSLVQGVGAEKQIAAGIAGLNNIEPKPDVIIVARGGGSVEDLWAFNEEDVLHAVFNSLIPVVSAVGHETDTTLIDYVSDKRAPTPTAAAELVAPVKTELFLDIKQGFNRMHMALIQYLKNLGFVIKSARILSPHNILEQKMMRLDDLSDALLRCMTSSLQHKALVVKRFALRRPRFDPLHQLVYKQFCRTVIVRLGHLAQKIETMSARLEQSSVEKILQKGYCIPLHPGGDVFAFDDFSESAPQEFELFFYAGRVDIKPASITKKRL